MTASRNFYVDETKAKGYVMVAASLTDTDVPRKELRELVLRGQRALHMRSENQQRRRALLTCIERMKDHGLQVSVYDAGNRHRSQHAARTACLTQIVTDAIPGSVLVLDRDETLVSADRQLLTELLRPRTRHDLAYRHAHRSEELLLAVPDALAWAWARGGPWKKRIRSVVDHVVQV